MDQDKILKRIASMVEDCEDHLSDQQVERERALEYYQGEMKDMPAEDGHSAVTSRDVRDTMRKVMPSIMRSLLSNDRIVEYDPVGPEDEEGAAQATDYVNLVVVPESGAERALYDAIQDALLLKTGILKWVAYKKRKAEVYKYTDIADADFIGLDGDPDVEILDHEESEETDPEVLNLDPNSRRHSFTLRRYAETTDIRLEAVPRGAFLIYPSAQDIESAPIVGERQEVTRTDLVAMGYDKKLVWELASGEEEDDDDLSRQGIDHAEDPESTPKASQLVTVYEVYVKLDQDGDGIAEMYRYVYGKSGEDSDGKTSCVLLESEPVTEAPYADVVAERDAHQFEGHSVFEDVQDIQKIKTSLLRNTLDNITKQNNPTPAVDLSQVENPDAIKRPRPRLPVILSRGADASRVLQWLQMPNIAPDTFGMLAYFDEVARDRTGITDASGGLDPEAFQNMTATSAQIMNEGGIAQSEMIINSLSGGIRLAFRGLLRLVIAHQDQPRTVRIRGKWVAYNPAQWNVDMDCTVNVGLGAGSRERDMAVLQVILNMQKELIANIGAENPYVKPTQLYNTIAKITEAAGLPSPDPFFTEPDPQEIQALMQKQAQKPDPQAEKVKMQMQLEAEKAKASQVKEQAQMQADLRVEQERRQSEMQIAALQAQLDYLKHADEMELEAAKSGLMPANVAGPRPMLGMNYGG